jgi:hypothetical protein
VRVFTSGCLADGRKADHELQAGRASPGSKLNSFLFFREPIVPITVYHMGSRIMPKLNAVAMVVLAAALIGGLGWFVLGRPEGPAAARQADVARALRKLADADPDVRREGEAALRALGPRGVEVLKETAKSADRHLAARAEKLLREAAPAPRPNADVAADPVQAPVRFVLAGVSREGDALRAYVRLVNQGTAPVLLDLRAGVFELEDEKGAVTRVAAEAGDDVVAVAPGETRDLSMDRAVAIRELPAPGTWRVRFVYDATEESAYRRNVRASERGALLPPLRHVTNLVEVVVAP